jgi:hypothetical protein
MFCIQNQLLLVRVEQEKYMHVQHFGLAHVHLGKTLSTNTEVL